MGFMIAMNIFNLIFISITITIPITIPITIFITISTVVDINFILIQLKQLLIQHTSLPGSLTTIDRIQCSQYILIFDILMHGVRIQIELIMFFAHDCWHYVVFTTGVEG